MAPAKFKFLCRLTVCVLIFCLSLCVQASSSRPLKSASKANKPKQVGSDKVPSSGISGFAKSKIHQSQRGNRISMGSAFWKSLFYDPEVYQEPEKKKRNDGDGVDHVAHGNFHSSAGSLMGGVCGPNGCTM
jgi:hypothetical protein